MEGTRNLPVLEDLRHSDVANYVCTTAFVIFLYDSTITIADEVSEVNVLPSRRTTQLLCEGTSDMAGCSHFPKASLLYQSIFDDFILTLFCLQSVYSS